MSEQTKLPVDAPALPAIGKRVALHPATDLWMRGARYGTVSGHAPNNRVIVRTDVGQISALLDAADVTEIELVI